MRDEAPEDVYWTARAFGLEGTATFDLAGSEFEWYGFLLDLACALAEWRSEDRRTFLFLPAEQAGPVQIERVGAWDAYRIGSWQAGLLHEESIELVDGWLARLGAEVLSTEPRLGDVPGFEWIRRASAN